MFGTDLASIPVDVPYVVSTAKPRNRWANRLPTERTPRVGIVWAGSPTHPLDRERSVPIAMLAPLLAVAGVRFCSLQKGAAAAELGSLPAGVAIADLGPELADFADTAAVISALDLVVCVDTAVAHLAGALGKPVWLLLPQPADWRWLEEREDSPWYPTMRLFRQRQRGDWDEVVARVKAALERWVGGDAAALLPPVRPSVSPPAAPVPVGAAWPPRGHRPGFSAVAETRVGILQYLPDDGDEGLAIGWYGEVRQRQLELLLRAGAAGDDGAGGGRGGGRARTGAGGGGGFGGASDGVRIAPDRAPDPAAEPGREPGDRRHGDARAVGATGRGRGGGRRRRGGGGQWGGSGETETVDELQLERLDWLKIDAADAAMDVLAGAAATLWRLRPWLFVAADEGTLAPLAQRAKEFGYRCWRQETPLFAPANFNRREDDLFAGRTAVALLAIPEEIAVDVALDACVELA